MYHLLGYIINGSVLVINNGLLINFGTAAPQNNRQFTFPCAFSSSYSVTVTSITPVAFDDYKCVSYIWSDSNLARVHVITTYQHTPNVYVMAIGF